METEKVQPQADVEKMEPQKAQPDTEPCWKKKAADAGFLANMKDHFDEFVNTSMDQHRICLKKTIHGVGGKLKKTGSRVGSSKAENDLSVKEVESSKQVQTTTTQ